MNNEGTFENMGRAAERDLSAAASWTVKAASEAYHEVRAVMPVSEPYKDVAMTAATVGVAALAARPLLNRLWFGAADAAIVRAEGVSIVPLTEENLPKAIAAGKDGFRYGGPFLNPAKDFKASLDPLVQAERAAAASKDFRVEMNARYWVAMDKEGEVVGTTGLYETGADKAEASWMGWMSVPSKYRGQGIGKKLVDFTVEQAKADGKQTLRLYTSNARGEAAAQGLYEKEGLKIVRTEPHTIPRVVQRLFGEKEPLKILVREMDLHPEAVKATGLK